MTVFWVCWAIMGLVFVLYRGQPVTPTEAIGTIIFGGPIFWAVVIAVCIYLTGGGKQWW